MGCRLPLQQAPLPGHATPRLAAAVAEAGALGMLPGAMVTPAGMESALASLAAATQGAFGVGFLMPFLDLATLDDAARCARVVEFFYASPDAGLVRRAGAGGARVGWQVGSLPEAKAAEGAGCAYVVVQGTEAGGHVRGRESLFPLLARCLDALRVPVLAAGGIATARDLAAVLGAGAGGARVGTRFLAAEEASVHPAYREALFAAEAADTELTTAFSVMWPDAPHRVLRSARAAAEALRAETVGTERLPSGEEMAVPRLAVVSPTREARGRVDAMALYAGESVGSVRRVEPAGDIVRELCHGAARLLGRS